MFMWFLEALFSEFKVFLVKCCFCSALVFSYDFHAGAETMYSRHFNDPAADSYFTKRKWGELLFSSLPPLHRNSPTPLRFSASVLHIFAHLLVLVLQNIICNSRLFPSSPVFAVLFIPDFSPKRVDVLVLRGWFECLEIRRLPV